MEIGEYIEPEMLPIDWWTEPRQFLWSVNDT